MSDWKPVAGFPYEVSDDGRVRRSAGGSNAAKVGRILRPHIDGDGYAIVTLSRNGERHTRKVHRLVCEAFNGPARGREVRHLDGDPANNAPANLRWGTQVENAADRARHGRTARGAHAVRARLSGEQAAALRAEHAQAKAGRQRVPRGWRERAGAKYGLTVNGVSTIVGGRGYA